jgi:tRNA threonylcarbamoyladenosine biosynthesis protein TsaB
VVSDKNEGTKVLALETSGKRGSVAIVEAGMSPPRVCGYRAHEVHNEHAERMLGLVDLTLADSGVSKTEIDRIAVGVGPGSFTGVRVAVALAQGLMMGLGVVGVGVGSLRAIAQGLPTSDSRIRVVVRDARRDEFFVAVYRPNGEELLVPHAIAQTGASSYILRAMDEQQVERADWVLVGTRLSGMEYEESEETREPDARPVGRLGLILDPKLDPVVPHYVRGPNLVKPDLPVSPLTKPRV